ncbi:MAG: helix-turn-helix transcriptional regulator, partial [Candidatus Tectomicrobia bacterium]|nr:helix-turn-helix transcriptional regulator [Candidatus Tectomicrobia bacterium]
GTLIVWAFADPVDRAGWGSAQVSMIKRLVPHVRQFVRVRQALSAAGALGASVTELLDNSRFGVIQLDRKKRIVEANDRARDVLRRGDGLFDKGGVLSAWLPADDAELQRLLAAALPPFGNLGTSSSMTLRRAFGLPRLVLHASPVVSRSAEFPSQRVAALVVVVDPANRPRIDPDLVAAGLGLTPSESQVAAMLSEGWSVRDIARMTGRQENSVYKLLKQAYRKHGINRQVDLIRLVLSLAELPGQGR